MAMRARLCEKHRVRTDALSMAHVRSTISVTHSADPPERPDMSRYAVHRVVLTGRRLASGGQSLACTGIHYHRLLLKRLYAELSVSRDSSRPALSSSHRPSIAAHVEKSDRGEIDLEKLLETLKEKHSEGKQYYETENEGIRATMLLRPEFREMFSSLPLLVGSKPPPLAVSRETMFAAQKIQKTNDLISLLKGFSSFLSLSRRQLVEDPAFLEFATVLASRLRSTGMLTFPEVQNLLQSYQRFRFEQLPHDFAPAHILRTVIDEKCLELFPQLTTSQAFVLSDLWFLAACSRLVEFPQYFLSRIKSQDLGLARTVRGQSSHACFGWKLRGSFCLCSWPFLDRKQGILPAAALMRVLNEVPLFQSQELVRLMFALSLQRSADPGLMLLIERMLLPHMATFSVEELGVICAGFFKTQTTPGAELVDKILSRLIELESDKLSTDLPATLFAKFLNRYSVGSHHELLRKFLDKIKPNLSRIGVTALAHVAAIQETTSTIDETLMRSVCERLIASLPNVRMKDLAKICQTCAYFGYRPEIRSQDFLWTVVEFLENRLSLEEVSLYPTRFAVLLASLAQMEVFSPQLLKIMSSRTFLKVYEAQPVSLWSNADLLQLHYAVELECPEWQLSVLPGEAVARMVSEELNKKGAIHTSILSLLTIAKTLFREADAPDPSRCSVALRPILPYTEDMVVLRVKGLDPTVLPGNILSLEQPHVIRPAPDDGTCYALVYHPWWNFVSPSQQLTGFERMKQRHLSLLGYKVVSIHQQEIGAFNFIQKVKYLRDRLFFDEFDVSQQVVSEPEEDKSARVSV